MLGCSTRLATLIALVVAILFFVGLVGGAIGQSLGADIGFLKVPPLEVHSFFKGDALVQVGGFTITNTLVASWITMVVVVLLAFAATRKMKVIPGRLQALVETAVETLLNFVEGVAGRQYSRKFFPVIATIFIFVMFNAYLALFPIFGPGIYALEQEPIETHAVGTITELTTAEKVEKGDWIATLDTGEEITAPISGHVHLDHDTVHEGAVVTADFSFGYIESKPPLFRSANTDINMTLAIALMAVGFIEFSGIRARGFRHWFSEYVNLGELGRGFKLLFTGKFSAAPMVIVTGVINAIMGLLEAVSHSTRMISFAFRLFGNMTAGEILLLSATFLIPWVMAIPFYGLELLIGFIQALIFGGLTLVFASIAVAHASEEH